MRETGPAGLAFTWEERRALRYCTYCPRMCRFACPVAHGEARESVTPWGLMRLLNLVDQGHVGADGVVLEALEHCVSCGRCQIYCRHDNPVAEVLAEARAQLLAGGLSVPHDWSVPPGGCELEVPLPERHAGQEGVPMFVPACAHAATPDDAALLARGLDALEAMGLPLATPPAGAQAGCGFHEWEVGLAEEARASWESFEALGLGRPACLTDCAAPLWTLEEQIPDAMGSVEHLLEWLHAHLDELPSGPLDRRVVVHDACHETRRLRLADALRAVVGRLCGREPDELYESREEARCCGAAGRWAAALDEAADRAAGSVVDDIADAGADLIVTANPHCRRSLAQVVAARGLMGPAGQPVDVVDLIGLIGLIEPGEPVEQHGGDGSERPPTKPTE